MLLRLKHNLFCVVIAIVLLSGCSNSNPNLFNNSSADWAFQFVVWNGYIYQLSDEYVENVDEKIGEVTKYSDMEGTYSKNFSNTYEKGTKYYAIQGISTEEAIAIEEDGRYKKAIRDGKYGEK
ncbi:MAG: hypothetical protein ABS939_19485 [Psychrobacillus sp.]